MTAALGRLMRTLARPGAFIEHDGEDYLLRAHADRRRKPLLRLTGAQMTALLRDPRLLRRPDKTYGLGAPGVSATSGLAAETIDIAEQWQTDETGRNVRRSVNRAESPMAWLMRHKDGAGLSFLNRAHLLALDKLRDDHLTGFAQPGLTGNWQAFGTGRGQAMGGDGPHVFRLAARQRCREALACLDGDLRAIFERVCLEGTSLGMIERGFRLPRRSGKHYVRAALDRLAQYYGYA